MSGSRTYQAIGGSFPQAQRTTMPVYDLLEGFYEFSDRFRIFLVHAVDWVIMGRFRVGSAFANELRYLFGR